MADSSGQRTRTRKLARSRFVARLYFVSYFSGRRTDSLVTLDLDCVREIRGRNKIRSPESGPTRGPLFSRLMARVTSRVVWWTNSEYLSSLPVPSHPIPHALSLHARKRRRKKLTFLPQRVSSRQMCCHLFPPFEGIMSCEEEVVFADFD